MPLWRPPLLGNRAIQTKSVGNPPIIAKSKRNR
jgi:hypothetical protein